MVRGDPSAEQILQRLGEALYGAAQDRHVYCVFGPYALLRPFQTRIQECYFPR